MVMTISRGTICRRGRGGGGKKGRKGERAEVLTAREKDADQIESPRPRVQSAREAPRCRRGIVGGGRGGEREEKGKKKREELRASSLSTTY